MKRVVSCFFLVVFILSMAPCSIAQKKEKKKKGPIEKLKDKWGQFDFQFGDNWEVERMSTFLLKSKEFVEDYYTLIKDSVEIDEEQKKNDIQLSRQYVIIEFNHQDLEKKVYDQRWDFELEVKDANKKTHEFEPIKVDTTELLRGEEMITGFKGFQPVTVIKKKGGVTQERTTPTFWKVEKSNLWNRTYIIYFPAFYPNSEIPIFSDRTTMIRFDADTKGIISMTGKWKFKDLPFHWE